MNATNTILATLLSMGVVMSANAGQKFETDTLATAAGDLQITCIGHGSLMFGFGDQIIYVDPYSKLADYAKLPKADAILTTHEHADHLDLAALKAVRKPETVLVISESCRGQVDGTVMTNGATLKVLDLTVEAVPAYNLVNLRPDGTPFHPRGNGNGYVLAFGDKRVYVAGDTENIPAMKALKNIDVAFLPMNLPYTMTPEMVADAARAFRPKILYPYHYGDTDTTRLQSLLKDCPEIEVRVRAMR